jgi:CRP/FNR family cyclic AMP-dependent transcriptional regulator
MAKKAKKVPFDPKVFLATTNGGRSLFKYLTNKVTFSQCEPADAVFYIQKGQVKITVVSEQGKEAVVAVLDPDEFCGDPNDIPPLPIGSKANLESGLTSTGRAKAARARSR